MAVSNIFLKFIQQKFCNFCSTNSDPLILLAQFCFPLTIAFRALQTSRVLHISMNAQLTYEPIVL